MKKKFWKRLISALLSTLLVVCLVSPASAKTVATGIQDEDLLINQEVAEYIAEFFVDDMIKTGKTKWSSQTHVLRTKPLYDSDGNKVNSYSVELTSGYVVVSAYIDVPNIILEWSDEVEPIYSTMSVPENSKIVFAGSLNYYTDNGEPELVSSYGEVVARNKVNNTLKAKRNIANVPKKIRTMIIEEKVKYAEKGSVRPFSNTRGDYITNPYTHAVNVYGGVWTEHESADNWSAYANYATMDEFPSNYQNHCGPTAITNMIKMYGNKYNNSLIKNSSNNQVFTRVMQANTLHSMETGIPYYNGLFGGTVNATADGFIKDSFAGFMVSVSVLGRYTASYSSIKTTLDSDSQLVYLMLQGHEPYGNHDVVGYAYIRLYSNSLNAYKSYIEICDGHNAGARYIDMGDIVNYQYWRVYL